MNLVQPAISVAPSSAPPATARPRMYLSPPHMGDDELALLTEAFRSNWIAPLGPHVDAFEREFAQRLGVGHAAAVASGTAALHLGLRLLGTEPGDVVICSSFTFCASATPILFENARPVLLDSDEATWNLDPQLLEEELADAARRGRLPRAVIVVDLYGQCANYDAIEKICGRYEVPILEDAAEALGASWNGRAAGRFGRMAAFSFNGNKIITTSGGGMLASDDAALIEKARVLASQARDPAPHYQHSQLGFNYRLSNLLAAVGRGQLRVLDDRVAARRRIFATYRELLGELPGLSFMPEHPASRSNRWLTCVVIDPERFGATHDDVRRALESDDIEARPLWKPLHLQPLFAGCRSRSRGVSESLFARGLCLPSGSAMTRQDIERVADIVRATRRRV
jgi:pyridoxal phosphate-dependent aminotransferase EpsN